MNNQIKDLERNSSIKAYYLVKTKKLRVTKTNKDYLDIVFEDKTGEISGKVWDNADKLKDTFEEGDIVYVEGIVESFNDKNQIKVQKIRKIYDDEVEPSKILPSAEISSEEMWAKLNSIIKKNIKNPFLLKLLERILNKYGEKLKIWPGARKVHHNYIGGLLEHTLAVVDICDFLSTKYKLDKELTITGGIIHDIGKIEEIKGEVKKEESEKGVLLGHIIIGVQILKEESEKIIGFPESLLTKLTHLIISHHGNYEFGAYQLPMTKEALALHFADFIDSQMNIFDNILKNHSGDSISTDYDYRIGRKLFAGDKE